MKKLWTIGREREKLHATKFVKLLDQQSILFPVIDAVHDLKEGAADTNAFIEAARIAMTTGGAAVWQNTTNWIGKVAAELPDVDRLWDELATSASWQVRWRVACVLYHHILEPQSDRIFSRLRYDKSNRVRETAIDRYENRPGPDRYVVFKMFDASDPASPGFDRSLNVH